MIYTIYTIFFLALCGIGSAIVAANKGRNGLGWFLLGFLLGPIGFILSLVVAKDVAALEESAVLSGESKKCPYCAEIIKREAIVCRFCGKEMPSAEDNSIPLPSGQVIGKDALLKKSLSTKEILEHEGVYIAYGKAFQSKNAAAKYIAECNKH